nr:hypothetical protein [Tanacetum cinerariifolium]
MYDWYNLLNSGITLYQQWELVFISSGKLLWQLELITASGNAFCILFPTINPINSNGDGEGKTTVVRCKNDSSIQMSNGLATLEHEMETSDKLNYLEHLIPAAPIRAHAGDQVALDALTTHAAWIRGSKEIIRLMLMTMEVDIQ